MELLLHYCWRHKMFPLHELLTTDGRSVEVIDVGLHNHDAGPDFFNAKIKVDGTLWVGNIELHDKASDWFVHHHDRDPRYDNVVLHVCTIIDAEAITSKGNKLPQLQLSVPAAINNNYKQLLREDKYPPCHAIIPDLPNIMVHSWLNALQVERLEQKTDAILHRVHLQDDSWEVGFFATLARCFGFGKNGDAFEQWASVVQLSAAAHHRDNELQIEAMFMGQAGLLSVESIPERYRQQALNDEYFLKLCSEYAFLRNKFHLSEMDYKMWNFLRLRPQNFPTIRLSQLAQLYTLGKCGLSAIVEADSINDIKQLLQAHASTYWQTHYIFGSESTQSEKNLSALSLNSLIINAVVPMLFVYGRHKKDDKLCDKAFDLLEQVQVEDNSIVRLWQECGLKADSAADSQALIQLKRQYCDRKECLRCRIGYEYLKRKTPDGL